MKLRSLIILAMAILSWIPAKAQYLTTARSPSINSNSVLVGPLDFFWVNSNHIWRVLGITNLDSLGKSTNGLMVLPVLTNSTLKGTTTLPNGSLLILPSGLDIMAEFGARGAATNGLFVGPTLTNAAIKGTTTLPNGSSLILPSGLDIMAELAARGLGTNGIFVGPTLTNATIKGVTAIPSGASVTGESGAAISFDRVTISGIPSSPTDAITKGIVDSLGNLVFLVVPPTIVNNLSELVGAPVGSVARFAYVRNSTSGDGAAGPWIWDPTSAAAAGPVVKKSSNLSPSDPGRWIKI